MLYIQNVVLKFTDQNIYYERRATNEFGGRRGSPKGLHVSSPHQGLQTLPGSGRTFARSPGLLPSGCPGAPPPPSSPFPTSSILPALGRLLHCLHARLAGSQARVTAGPPRRARVRARGSGRAALGSSGDRPPPGPGGRGPGRCGAGRAAWPLPSAALPKVADSLGAGQSYDPADPSGEAGPGSGYGRRAAGPSGGRGERGQGGERGSDRSGGGGSSTPGPPHLPLR
ncbi:hypothetical protein ACRRTK_015234 [Alexandromys fortis]